MELSEELQIRIRDTGNSNQEFAKIHGIKKTELTSILRGAEPNKFTLSKICRALDWEWTPEVQPLPVRPPINKNIVKADFKKNPKSPLKAKGHYCFRCLIKDGIYVYEGLELCHYTGIKQHLFDKAKGQKGSHILQCPLCKKCHKHFDEPKVRKSVELSEEFMTYICLFIKQKYESGSIIIKP